MNKEYFIETLQSFQQQKNLLFDSLKRVPKNILETPYEQGKWSILQILYHIQMSENGTLAYMEKKSLYAATTPIPRKNIFSSIRGALLQYLLKSNIKRKAPKGLDTFPETIYLDKLFRDSQTQFQKWIHFVQKSDEHILHSQIFKHPLVGRIDFMDTIEFTILHFDRHLKQIVKIIQKENEKSKL